MASENETVEQVCEKWLGMGFVYTYESGLIYSELDSDELKEKILRAYKREVEELRECLGSMQTWFRLYFHCDNNPISPNRRKCTTCRLKKCPCHKWRKTLDETKGANDELH